MTELERALAVLENVLPYVEDAKSRGLPNAAHYVEVINSLVWPGCDYLGRLNKAAEAGGHGVDLSKMSDQEICQRLLGAAQGIEARKGGDAYRAEANALSPRGRGSIVRREPGPKDAPKASREGNTNE